MSTTQTICSSFGCQWMELSTTPCKFHPILHNQKCTCGNFMHVIKCCNFCTTLVELHFLYKIVVVVGLGLVTVVVSNVGPRNLSFKFEQNQVRDVVIVVVD